MERKLTVFKSVFDHDTSRVVSFNTWDHFVDSLRDMSGQQYYKPNVKDPSYRPKGINPAFLISPAVYTEGETRANKNVIAWAGWACVDVDDIDVPPSDLREELSKMEIDKYEYVCYSTASCRDDQSKFRLLFPLTRHITHDEIPHFWFAINKLVSSLSDPQTKDLSRMYYIPADYPEATNFFWRHSGEFINPSVVMDQYEFVEERKGLRENLSDAMKTRLMQHTMKKLYNRDIVWSSYRDCPFVKDNLIREYENIAYTDGTGRYAMLYKIMASVAFTAVNRGYPITVHEIVQLVREIDMDNSNIYEKRPLQTEAKRALEYALTNVEL